MSDLQRTGHRIRPERRLTPAHRAVAVLAGAGVIVFVVGLGLGVALIGRHGGGALQDWDNTVWRWSIAHRAHLTGVSKVVAILGDAAGFGLICVLVTVILLLTLRSPRALIPIVAYLGGEGEVYLIRQIMHRDRPPTANFPAPGAVPGIHETSYSYPSGHAVAVTAVLFAALGAVAMARRWWWPWLLAGVASLFVADTRLVLGVHWFSDVAIGIVLGISWGITVALVVRALNWADLQHPWQRLPAMPTSIAP